jgi:hypothetical protein
MIRQLSHRLLGGTSKAVLAAAAIGAAGLLAMPSIAHADEINLGGASGSITFTSNGNGTVSFTTSGFTTPGLASFQSPNGTELSSGSFTLGAMTGTMGPESDGIFDVTIGGVESFTYTATVGYGSNASANATDKLTGTVDWNGVKDGTSTPQFDDDSELAIATSVGSSTFTNDFKTPIPGMAEIDFTVNLSSSTLTTLAGESAGTQLTGTFSSGEVTPVPEPVSLILFGSGLIGLGAARLRRRAKL